eukprot:CAMPEP_0201888256 /NCGR_PEP_ID=MMETSP0902-20130614/27123_1 /ASSEMBLY_ACC=CAM_ASM_000551 /TAXON_ID=420261 /ORGANISM="Thalassiosira antarctica, Strain CCMP982" /LENGTH=291 /DNA_ID=CAMNT_0048418465 /DNA_START=129 /DNA_END=1004 /DNA_ORIENTATION=+
MQESSPILDDVPATSSGSGSGLTKETTGVNVNAITLTNITGGNIPPQLSELRSNFLAKLFDPPSATAGSLDAAYFHMLQIRAGADFHRFGSTGTFHSQWQTNYWKARKKYIQGEVKTICEAGLGSGHSGIVLLTATTNTSWYNDGATFHSFDNGLKNEPHKKVAAYNYMKSTFGGRVNFHFGPQSSVEVEKVKEQDPEFTCDIVHIDADHSTAGVMKDIDAMHKVSHGSTVLLMDDYDSDGIRKALEGKKDKVTIDTVYSQEGMTDWMIQSAEKKKRTNMKKVYIVGHFLH